MKGERYVDYYIFEYDRFGGGWVMVWVGIGVDYRINLYVIEGF